MFAVKSISRMFSASIVFAFILALTLSALSVTPAYAVGIRYVKPGGTGNCSSWATACNLQTALTGAVSGNELWVAAGVYKPGTARTATFHLKNGVAVYGGFAGTETQLTQRLPATHVTILSGDIDNNDSQKPIITNLATVTGNTTNSYAVVIGATGATLDGFTITAGSADGTNPGGGGMYNTGSPTLANLVFRGNTSSNSGGGMENYFGNPTLTNVVFTDNFALSNGGGMDNEGGTSTLTNVTFNYNTAHYHGGGLSDSGTSTLTNVTFSGNVATGHGGGIYSQGDLTLNNATFSDNIAGSYGGGMYNAYNTTTLTNVTFSGNSASKGGGIYSTNTEEITNVTFSSNSAGEGGGIYNSTSASSTLANVTFIGNSASSNGGGIYIGYPSSGMTLMNVTFRSNSATNHGGGIGNYNSGGLSIYNTILWDNTSTTGAQIYNSGTSFVNDSVVQGGCPAGSSCTNIIIADPLLGPLGNYGGFTQTIRLLTGSSAIDTGNDTTCLATDQRGTTRPQGAHCDIGAFEYVVPVPHTLTFNSIDAQDGWVLESTETSNVGGTLNSTSTIWLGDNAAKKQFRGILSFSTASLPDTAIITGVTLKVRQQAIVGSGNPLSIFQGFMVDIKNGFLGTSALQITDFQTLANHTYGPFSPALVGNLYSIDLTGGKADINKLASNGGLTQIRLRFKLDDNNDALANYLSLFSGNTPTAANRPQLVIAYYVP